MGWLRDAVQTLHLARVVRPRGRFLVSTARNREGRYTSKGLEVGLRGRRDLQAAREHLSKRSYRPPAGVPFDPARTLDLGANIGLFSLVLQQRCPEARIVALEPDADSLRLLRANVAANGRERTIEVRPAAAGTEAGQMPFLSGRHHLSRVARPEEREHADTVAVIDVLPLAGEATFVKIDIEGGEWPLLRDPRLAAVRATLAMEWHAFESGGGDARAEAERLLREAGFQVRHEPPESPDTGFLWAWRD